MKHLFFLFLILTIAAPALAQIPDAIPDDYQRKYKRLERRLDRIERRDSPDIILDPIESLPIEPTFYAMETGNWGGTYLGVNQRADEIRKRAKRPVVVFIFDTAGEYDHPFLAGKAWNDLGRVFTGENSGKDGHGHSTHVAGIIAAEAPDYPLGVARMLPDLKIVPIKVLSNQGSGSFSGIIAGTQYANEKAKELIGKGWFVVYNYSLGGSTPSDGLEKAFKEAESLGVLINCAANGNTGRSPIQYPGRSEYTLGTAALQQSGGGVTRASYSSYGPETWAAMPGSSILSTWPGGGVRLLNGTSMATPHLAGLFAILGSIYPEATAEELKAHFIEHATDLGSPGRDEYYGYGSGIITPLLDNQPSDGEPGPPPPTCTDGIKNGKETGIDCGGPDCPPCEPEGPPIYKERSLPVIVRGSWSVSWWNNLTRPAEPEVYDLSAASLVSPAGRRIIHIKEIGYTVEMKSGYNYEAETLENTVNRAFRNTGIGTNDADEYDAAKFLTYIPEYFGKTKDGYTPQDLTPIHLMVVVDGVEITFRPEDLRDHK